MWLLSKTGSWAVSVPNLSTMQDAHVVAPTRLFGIPRTFRTASAANSRTHRVKQSAISRDIVEWVAAEPVDSPTPEETQRPVPRTAARSSFRGSRPIQQRGQTTQPERPTGAQNHAQVDVLGLGHDTFIQHPTSLIGECVEGAGADLVLVGTVSPR